MNRHFSVNGRAREPVWLGIDRDGSGTNVLTEGLLEELDQTLVQAAQLHPAALIIYSEKPAGFVAGADINLFSRVSGAASVERHIRRVHQILHRLESLACPTVAAVHGYCLGGGLELALACDYRVCSDDDSTRLGFPEVRLGLFPGYGGTVRSTRLIGDLAALRLMLGGHTVGAAAALRLGLVDQVVPWRQLRNAAAGLAADPSRRPRRATWLQRLPGSRPARPVIQRILAHRVAGRVRRAHHPAPFELLAHWSDTAGQESRMYASEAHRVARLLGTDTAQNLVRVFQLRERLKGLGERTAFEPRHVHVVGGGVMGGDIAAWCAHQGMRVTLQDRAPEYLGRAVQRAHALFRRRCRNPHDVQAAIDRLMPDHRGIGLPVADVVIEAIFEDPAAKQNLHAELEAQMPADAVLATNTSSIPLAVVAAKLRRPERLVGLHYFNPVAKMPLVEVIHDTATEAPMVDRAMTFVRRIDKLPLPVRSRPGFLVNRILMPYLIEAVDMLEEGIPARLIDAAAVDFGMPVGPIELADSVGLDICLSVATEMSSQLHHEVPRSLAERVESGLLGRKTGSGFYQWHQGRVMPADEGYRGNTTPADICDRLILRLVNESMACLREGIVDDEDLLDAGVIFGTGFAPFRGGPIRFASRQGVGRLRHRLDELEHRFGTQFHADPGWGALA